MKNMQQMLEEFLSPIIKKSVSEAIRNENQKVQKPIPPKRIGGIDLAIEVTGLAKPTIYAMTSKGTIPHFKRGAKLYFDRELLLKWIEEGNSKAVRYEED
jgi:excisionase family DNA binding protein